MNTTAVTQTKATTSISISEEVKTIGQARAAKEKRSFSKHLEWLIEQDAKRAASETHTATTEAAS